MLCLVWTLIAFLAGSIPFSVWIGRIFLHTDIRNYGDGAPGATNVARAGGRMLYITAVLLDAFKGTVPIWLAQLISGLSGWELAVAAVAAVAGHAFTPFLKGKGGMGVATTFGVWLGLLGWLGPVALGFSIGLMFVLQKNWVWASVGGMIIFLLFLLLAQFPISLAGINLSQTSIMVIKRFDYFKKWPELQPWLVKRGKK